MNALRFSFLNCLFAASLACTAEPQIESFNVDKASGYHPVIPALKSYLETQGAKKGRQHICVIGYVEPISGGKEKDYIAWVYWREGNRITLWEPAAEGFESKDSLKHSRRDLDITEDITSSDEEVGSSTYKESSIWLEEVKKDCQKRGKSYELIIN